MRKIILGDNPFFAISHLDSSKSKEYLEDKDRFDNASKIIRSCKDLGIAHFMISSHSETNDLLAASGFSHKFVDDLPKLCIVVPNVHELNKNAARNGIMSALKKIFKIVLPTKAGFISVLSGVRLSGNVSHLALHNVVSDLLIGLNSRFAFKLFHYFCKTFRLKSVILTLNPIHFLKLGVPCDVVCTYYNETHYNVCYSVPELFEALESMSKRPEIWAMGISASGAVSSDRWSRDQDLSRFDGTVVASSRREQITKMAEDARGKESRHS